MGSTPHEMLKWILTQIPNSDPAAIARITNMSPSTLGRIYKYPNYNPKFKTYAPLATLEQRLQKGEKIGVPQVSTEPEQEPAKEPDRENLTVDQYKKIMETLMTLINKIERLETRVEDHISSHPSKGIDQKKGNHS